MAITSTTSGSEWAIWQGVEDDIVSMLYASGLNTVDVRGFTGPNDVGSFAVLVRWKV